MHRFTIPLILIVAATGLWQSAIAQNFGGGAVYAPLVQKAPEPTATPTFTPTPRPTSTPRPTNTPIPPDATFEDEVIRLTNVERARVGCPPLLRESHLMNAAEGHSTYMALNDYFGHDGPGEPDACHRILDAGYGGMSQWAENIAAGYTTPQSAINAWMASPPHRANILNCSLDEIGVGYVYINPDPGNITYRHYWTQVFASPGNWFCN